MVMEQEIIHYLRKHPYWYVKLCHYPESYDDLLEEIHQKKTRFTFRKTGSFFYDR